LTSARAGCQALAVPLSLSCSFRKLPPFALGPNYAMLTPTRESRGHHTERILKKSETLSVLD